MSIPWMIIMLSFTQPGPVKDMPLFEAPSLTAPLSPIK